MECVFARQKSISMFIFLNMLYVCMLKIFFCIDTSVKCVEINQTKSVLHLFWLMLVLLCFELLKNYCLVSGEFLFSSRNKNESIFLRQLLI